MTEEQYQALSKELEGITWRLNNLRGQILSATFDEFQSAATAQRLQGITSEIDSLMLALAVRQGRTTFTIPITVKITPKEPVGPFYGEGATELMSQLSVELNERMAGLADEIAKRKP